MSPEERQLLQGVFDRMRNNANGQRDPEADRLIADNVRQQPYSPYYLTQAVIVQEQALQAASQRIQQLEQQAQQAPQHSSGGGGFLSSIFGSGAAASREPVPAQRPPVWNQGSTQAPPPGYGQQPGYGQPQQQGYGQPQQQGGPWGAQQPQAPAGGGFLKGALGTAAGVAGGALMFEGIRGLMGGHGGGFGGLGMGEGVAGVPQETVVNNYYGDGNSQTAADYQQDMAQDSADNAGGTAADWQQDADQDMDDSQDSGDNDGSYNV